MARLLTTTASALLAALGLVACRSIEDKIPLQALEVDGPQGLSASGHHGPPVVAGQGGAARYVSPLYDGYDTAYARRLLSFIDGFYRAPGNDGYEAVLDRLRRDLAEAGFGTLDGFELYVIESPLTARSWTRPGQRVAAPAWTPVSARMTLKSPGRPVKVLDGFSGAGDTGRTMLPVNTPSALVEATVALDLEALDAGEILVTQAPPSRSLIQRATAQGAVAIFSSNLETYNLDPSGKNRQDDAIQYRVMPIGLPVPVAMISPRSHEAIASGHLADPRVTLRFESTVKLDERPLRTLVALVRGKDRPGEVFTVASHIQEPGANDNATGVVGLAESARTFARLVRAGTFERPSRTLAFVWGDEFRQTSAFLEQTDMVPVGGLSSDMTGASRAATGAQCLLERMPDPAAVRHLPPDAHTPWGQAEVEPASLAPNGLAVMARVAMVDMGGKVKGWQTSEHPYEGGSDHDIFIARGLPTALFWHFTDFTYHTSLDRMEMVDHEEMRRTAVAILATALCAADPRPEDLDRYLRSLDQEERVRVDAALAEGDDELAELWRSWCKATRAWLRGECLRLAESER